MTVTITKKEDTDAYSNLLVGDTFLVEDELCIKSHPDSDGDSVSVRLSDGAMKYFSPSQKVVCVDCDIVVKRSM